MYVFNIYLGITNAFVFRISISGFSTVYRPYINIIINYNKWKLFVIKNSVEDNRNQRLTTRQFETLQAQTLTTSVLVNL